jgi:hypothetical protein
MNGRHTAGFALRSGSGQLDELQCLTRKHVSEQFHDAIQEVRDGQIAQQRRQKEKERKQGEEEVVSELGGPSETVEVHPPPMGPLLGMAGLQPHTGSGPAPEALSPPVVSAPSCRSYGLNGGIQFHLNPP